jgi:predicted ArsR family transcriptional regulator
LITSLKGRLSSATLEDVLREVGRSIAAQQSLDKSAAEFEGRVGRALEVLKALGGSARVEREEGKLIIRSGACPLSAAVVEHPEMCELAEALVAEIIGVPVQERCDRGESPKCCFELGISRQSTSTDSRSILSQSATESEKG